VTIYERQKVDRGSWLRYTLLRVANWLIPLVLSLAAVVVLAGFAEAGEDRTFVSPFEWLGTMASGEPIARLTGAVCVLFVGSWLSVVGLFVLRRLLSLNVWTSTPLSGAISVARTGLDEAVRNRTVVVILLIMLLALALQPYFAVNAEQPLRYKIQTFFTISGFIAAALLGAVTIFVAAATVATDLEDKRGGDVFVKPIPRWAYLVGRWLGITLPMIVIVGVWAILTIGISTIWLAPQKAFDAADRDFVDTRVMVAREEAPAQPARDFREIVDETFEETARLDPERLNRQGRAAMIADLVNEQRTLFLQVPFGPAQGNTYRFTDLGDARERAMELDQELRDDADAIAALLSERGVETTEGQPIQPNQVSLATVLPFADLLDRDLTAGLLQLRFKVLGTNTYGGREGDLALVVDDRPELIAYVVDRVQIYDLPATLIGEDGVLELRIDNLGQTRGDERTPITIQFVPDIWINLYYVSGDVKGNVFRQAIVLWVRLSFLAMFATCAASLMSFPVAATLSLAVWVLAAGGSWLKSTLTSGISGDGVVSTLFERSLLQGAIFVADLLGQYSAVDGISRIAAGIYLPWSSVVSHTFWIGLVWTVIAFAIGWFLFSRKELARVQV
jgi:ABC-type transport system involved in multi-copper enzyme maturation permease subunit